MISAPSSINPIVVSGGVPTHSPFEVNAALKTADPLYKALVRLRINSLFNEISRFPSRTRRPEVTSSVIFASLGAK